MELFTRLYIRLREAVSLYKVSEAIAASLSLEEVLSTVGDAAIHDVGADQWPHEGVAEFRHHAGRPAEAVGHEMLADLTVAVEVRDEQ